MIKKLLSFAAFAVLAVSSANAADPVNLTMQPGWGASGGLNGVSLTCNSQWGQYHVWNEALSIAEYKGCEIEYTTTDAESWQFKIESEDPAGGEKGVEHYNPLAADQNTLTVSFADYTGNVKYIDIQGKVADAKIVINSFSLIKADDTKVPVTSGSAVWGITVGAYATPCAFTFTDGYGCAELLADGKSIEIAAGSKGVYTIKVELAEGAPTEILIEADDEKAGFAWSYPNCAVGEKEVSIVLDGSTLEKDCAKVYVKAAAKSETPVKFASATMTVEDGGSSAIENVAFDENAPVEYFNLQGVKVANPANGIYVVRQGNKVSKVLVK